MTAMPEVLREDTLNIPDSRGLNLYTCDPALERLLEVYLPPALLAEWRPLLERLGARAGGELDVLALAADKNPPVLAPAHPPRRGFAEHSQASGLRRPRTGGLCRTPAWLP
ncbi:hypothetical protein P4203_18860 [Pseudomonas aeruginosa]|nr:hypothetical protein [Pseudomonas aeruginosa]